MHELKIALVGWGYWGPKIARNIHSIPQAQLAWVADSDPQRLAKVRADMPWVRATTDAAEVFASDADAVVIATPVRSHHTLARQALLAGKHVLVEKPLTASVAEAEDLVALAQEMRLTLMVGHTFVYSPPVMELREIIRANELGHVLSLSAERLNLGIFRSDTDVIWDLAPHDVSIILYLLGEMPSRVRATARDHLRRDICDTAHLEFEFDGGATAHVHVSWLHPEKTRRVSIIGDSRMAIYDDTNPSEALRIFNVGADEYADPEVASRAGRISIPHIDWSEPLRAEVEDFAHAITTGALPRASALDGLRVVRILEAAHHALVTGRSIEIAADPAATLMDVTLPMRHEVGEFEDLLD